MRIALGLGNPGARYTSTRHNIGFMAVDHLAARRGVDWQHREDAVAEVAAVELGGQEVMLVKPQTFMNSSGKTVAALCAQWQTNPQDVLVVFDDFLLDFGRFRFRRGGSDGGHNGLASVLEELNTQDVPRLRMGIGSPPEGGGIIDYVLDSFSPEDEVEDLLGCCENALEKYYAEGVEAAMNSFNGS
ncbi:MAG TPA: aminoacyl-tRNA hydrolase [Candidatus Latescibacteria bacterium]|nr:aminoacyl-tRNA hydrolase [Candidatus Handelsmanbacteria bacterium]HIL08616.1 aminoacyl-tRNA hydrolase [Candidatus Latescibacterota bacterium]